MVVVPASHLNRHADHQNHLNVYFLRFLLFIYHFIISVFQGKDAYDNSTGQTHVKHQLPLITDGQLISVNYNTRQTTIRIPGN
jgi:hypothetical protein